MKPIDVTSDSYAEYNDDSNKSKPKFKVGDHVRISRYRHVYGLKKFLLLAKLKIQFRGHT